MPDRIDECYLDEMVFRKFRLRERFVFASATDLPFQGVSGSDKFRTKIRGSTLIEPFLENHKECAATHLLPRLSDMLSSIPPCVTPSLRAKESRLLPARAQARVLASDRHNAHVP